MRRIALAALLLSLALPAGARAAEERSKVDLPAGTAQLAEPELHAGAVGERIRVDVDLAKDPGDAALRVTLPPPFGRVTGAPTLTDDASGRIDADTSGRTVTLGLDAARRGDSATLAIANEGLPAGEYELPVRWVRADGTSEDAGDLRVHVEPGERESRLPDWNRVEEVRVEQNASSDSAEESETFDVVAPFDSDRIMASANKGGDLSGGFFLSNDTGHSWSELHLTQALAVPGGGVQSPSLLSGDPILAADDLGNIWAGGLTSPDCSRGFASRIFVERLPAGASSFPSPGVGLPTNGDDACDPDTLQDKPMMTIDTYPTSPTYGRLYVSWDDPDQGVNVVVSFCDTRPGGQPNAARCDDPNQWSAPTVVSGPEGSYISPDPAVGPDGRVYVVWWDYAGSGAGGNAIKIASCPGGAADCRSSGSWTSPAAVAKLTTPTVPFACPTPAQPGGRVGEVPSIAVGPEGRLYVSWSDLRADSDTGGNLRCPQNNTQYASVSDAQTWDSFVATAPSLGDLLAASGQSSTAVGSRVLTDGGSGTNDNSDEWFPWVAVDHGSGQAFVDFYSSTGDTSRRTSAFFVRSVGPGSGTQPAFGSLAQVSGARGDYSGTTCCVGNNPTFANDYGDYTGLTAAEGLALPIWTRRVDAASRGEEILDVPAAPSPQFIVDGASLSDSGGDGDGVLEPGEPFSLSLRVRNTGPVAATNPRATLIAPAGGATIDGAVGYPDVPPGGTASGVSAFTGRIANTVPCGATVSLRVDFATDQGPESVPVLATIGCAGGFTPPSTTNTTTTPAVIPRLPTTSTPTGTIAASPGGKATVTRQRLSTVLRRGLLNARVSCTRTCTMRLTLLLPPPKGKRSTTVTLATLTVKNLKSAKTVRLKLGKVSRRRLRSSHRKKLTLQMVTTTAAGGRQSRSVTVTLR